MAKFKVESEGGTEEIEAADIWEAAGSFAAKHSGIPSEDPCWDGFMFAVEGKEFSAEVQTLTGPGAGLIRVENDEESRFFNENGLPEGG